MIALDSSAWIEILGRSSNGRRFRDAMSTASGIIVPAVCMYEVGKWLLRNWDDEDLIAAALSAIAESGSVVDVDASLALRAAQTSLTTGLAMADAIILTTARSSFAALWTQDEHFAGLEGVEYLPRRDG